MSTWITIKDKEYVELDVLDDSIDVMIGGDEFGNNYVSIPVKFILEVLKDNGYEIK